ncbi:hypothetical protein [[Clostridium] fimetarium]|nr:hypothetical protein [[Clostridium] fimetarium]
MRFYIHVIYGGVALKEEKNRRREEQKNRTEEQKNRTEEQKIR